MRTQNIIAALTAALLITSPLLASPEKGKKFYIKTCKKCHGTGGKGASMQTMDEWEELFSEGAEELIEKHENTGAKNFFNSKKFKKFAPSLKDFLHYYGSDSGNVPSC